MSWKPANHQQFSSVDDAVRYYDNELRQLSQYLGQAKEVAKLQTLSAPPLRPEEGDIVKADGTNWDPASSQPNPANKGAGVYVYRGGAWVKMDVLLP